jgi:hypothetical protein
MDDFNERLKRAARNFAQKSSAEEEAHKTREKDRASFLSSFWDTGHNTIEPAMKEAQRALAPPEESEWSDTPAKKDDRIGVGVKWSDNDDRLIFSLSPGGTKHAVLVFLADPIKMRVRVLSAATDLTNRKGWERVAELTEGACNNIQSLAELKLEEVTAAIVRNHVATFVEQQLGG